MKKITIILLLFWAVISGCNDNKSVTDKIRSDVDIKVTSEKKVLYFGLYASENYSELIKKYIPLLNHIQEQLHQANIIVNIRFKGYSTYDECIQALSSGECDFTRFGPSSYILAKRRNKNIRLIAEYIQKELRSKTKDLN